MPIFGLLIAVLAAYLALDFAALPLLEARWKTSSNGAKLSKVGAVAGLKTLRDFLKIALWVFGVSTLVLGALSLTAPLAGASMLIWTHDAAAAVEGAIQPVRDWLPKLTLWIAAAALAFVAYRARRGTIATALAREHAEQFQALIRQANEGELQHIAPDERMTVVTAQLAACDAQLYHLNASNAPPDLIEQIQELRDRVAEQLAIFDLDRRIDLTKVPVFDELGQEIFGGLCTALFSRGMSEILSGSTKLLARVGTALACILTIGIAAPAIATSGIVPVLERLTDVQVLRNEQAAAEALNRIASGPPPSHSVPRDEGEAGAETDAGAYRQAATQFVRMLARSAAVEAAARRSLPNRSIPTLSPVAADVVEEAAVRQSILRLDASGPEAAARQIELAPLRPATDGSQRAFERFEAYRKRTVAAGPTPAFADAVDRVERWIATAARQSPVFRERLLRGVASFREPRAAWDFTRDLIGESLSTAIKEALPDPSKAGLFEKKIGTGGRKSLESGLERLIRTQLSTFLNGMLSGQEYAQALRAVRSPERSNFLLRRSEAEHVRTFISDAQSDRRVLAESLVENPPSLVERTRPAQRALVTAALRPLNFNTIDIDARERAATRQALEGNLGNFDDLFPAQRASATQTPLGSALAEPSGGPDIGVPEFGDDKDRARRTSKARTSRSFAGLRGSFRLGGVLIGAEPSGSNDADYRDLVWTRRGRFLSLVLVDSQDRGWELGEFDASTIQQALAYAADGRPTAVTMTSGPIVPNMLRVHTHPALVNTELGCSFVELDRFVDAATGQWPARSYWQSLVQSQLRIYQDVHQILGSEEPEIRPDSPLLADPRSSVNAAFGPDWRADDPKMSFFAYHPDRFDLRMVGKIRDCGQRSAARGDFLTCIREHSLDPAFALQNGTVWSGVRERDYVLAPNAFARGRTPLRFMLQLAFADGECGDAPCPPRSAKEPWEFPVIAPEIDRMASAYATQNPARQKILAQVDAFTRLQRLFRAGLAGKLGRDFPRRRLVALMRDAKAAASVRLRPTPEWSGSREAAVDALTELERERGSGSSDAMLETRATFVRGLLVSETQGRFSGPETCSLP